MFTSTHGMLTAVVMSVPLVNLKVIFHEEEVDQSPVGFTERSCSHFAPTESPGVGYRH